MKADYHESKQTLSEFRKKANLVDIASFFGFKVERMDLKWIQLSKLDEQLIVSRDRRVFGYIYYQSLSNPRDRGSVIDFLEKREEKPFDLDKFLQKNIPPVCLEEFEISLDFEESLEARTELESIGNQYLGNESFLESQGIDKKIINKYNLKTNKSKAIFPLYLGGKLVSTITYSAFGGYFQKRLNRGILVLGHLNAEYLVIHNSAIDALKYEQEAIKNRNFGERVHVCTCGKLSAFVLLELEKYVATRRKIILNFGDLEVDNDFFKPLNYLFWEKFIIIHTPKKAKSFKYESKGMESISKIAKRKIDLIVNHDKKSKKTTQKG